jgi:hypothetical protein
VIYKPREPGGPGPLLAVAPKTKNKYHRNLGTTLTNQVCIPVEIRTDLGECVTFGRELFVVLFATKNVKIKAYNIITLSVGFICK